MDEECVDALSPEVNDEITLDLSMRRDATVDALLCLQSEPIDFSRKTLDNSGGGSGLSALAAAVSDDGTVTKVTRVEQTALDTLAVAAVDAGSSSGVSSLHASPVRSELGIDESTRYVTFKC